MSCNANPGPLGRFANCFSCWIRVIAVSMALLPFRAAGQQPAAHQQILQLVDQHAAHFSEISRTIWEYPELGYQEVKSSAVLQRELQSAGFRVQSAVADEPTA